MPSQLRGPSNHPILVPSFGPFSPEYVARLYIGRDDEHLNIRDDKERQVDAMAHVAVDNPQYFLPPQRGTNNGKIKSWEFLASMYIPRRSTADWSALHKKYKEEVRERAIWLMEYRDAANAAAAAAVAAAATARLWLLRRLEAA